MKKPTVLFLGKEGDRHSEAALAFLSANCDVESHLGKWGDPLPEQARRWDGDYIISYLSRWIVPEALIARATAGAINFHPPPPNYHGVGCYNFALYDNVDEYGATCHFMAAKVDSGEIIATKRFPVFPSDDVASLVNRTYDFQLILFYEVVGQIIKGEQPHASGEKWGGRPFSRKELNALSVITPDMSEEEVARRIRATRFGPWKPIVEIAGRKFELV